MPAVTVPLPRCLRHSADAALRCRRQHRAADAVFALLAAAMLLLGCYHHHRAAAAAAAAAALPPPPPVPFFRRIRGSWSVCIQQTNQKEKRGNMAPISFIEIIYIY
jgi:hypothetical protein